MATKIVRDNCKDCASSCEHAGKDREFVCVKGVSCKTVKPKLEMVATEKGELILLTITKSEKGEPMQMNQMEHELWKMAAWIVCPWCDERKCVGR